MGFDGRVLVAWGRFRVIGQSMGKLFVAFVCFSGGFGLWFCVRVCVRVRERARTCVCMHSCMHHAWVCMGACMCVYACIHIYTCVCECMCACACMFSVFTCLYTQVLSSPSHHCCITHTPNKSSLLTVCRHTWVRRPMEVCPLVVGAGPVKDGR